jgi:hypothetical protein
MIILQLSTQLNAYSQSLPVGTPGLEEYYRRAQLMGKLDSTISFCANPLFHASNSSLFTVHSSLFTILPITLQQQYNTHHPYSINDGAMIPARGYQTSITAGVFAKLGPLSIQLYPELVYAQNKRFETSTNPGAIAAYNGFHTAIDLPEYFPERPYKKLFPGQSSIRLTAGPVSLGISSENLWWGPGTRNALMMSNSAPGFYHLTFNTVRPIRTPIGSFEGQVIGGRLETSNFLGEDASGKPLYYTSSNDWRYLNAMVLSYQPRWIKGLFVGMTRSFMMMWQNAKANGNIFPVVLPLAKKDQYGNAEQTYPEDQQISFFARWLLPADHAEIYTEYARGDHNYDLRDMFLQPNHFRAYMIGFKKLFYHDETSGKYVEFNLELTQLEQNLSNHKDRAVSFFGAYGAPLRGNTNQGQMLGAGIGTGSNLQTISLSWGKGLDNIGFVLERFVHNNDLYHQISTDPRGHWVDINIAFKAQRSYKQFLLAAKVEGIRSYNYEYSYVPPVSSSTTSYWTPGKDAYNLQANLAVTYRF